MCDTTQQLSNNKDGEVLCESRTVGFTSHMHITATTVLSKQRGRERGRKVLFCTQCDELEQLVPPHYESHSEYSVPNAAWL